MVKKENNIPLKYIPKYLSNQDRKNKKKYRKKYIFLQKKYIFRKT